MIFTHWKKGLLMLLMVCLLITLVSGAALASPPTDYAPVAYPSFSSTDGLTLSGTTTPSLDVANSRIQIVPYDYIQVGGVFTTDKVSMGSNGFSMAAQVYCGPTSAQADGFALVLSKNTKVCIYDGSGIGTGGSLGYAGMYNSIAVQYFTYSSSNIALGIDGNQNRNNSDYVGFEVPIDGSVYMWLDYNAANTTLAVYASTTSTRPADPVTIYSIDLSSYGDYYIGVTSATGGSYQEYALAQWYYDAAYHSDSLKLDGSINYTSTLAAEDIIAQSATNVTSSSATLRGQWGSNYDSYNKSFEYKKGESGSISTVAATADGTADISRLTTDSTYYFCACATDGTTNAASVWQTFTTENQLTVSGNAAPYYLGIALVANDNGSYSVHPGMEITIESTDSDDKIRSITVNGTVISKPWTFTITGNTTVVVTTEENTGDFWVYDGEYVYGVYDEDSTYDDIDWNDAVDSSVDPLDGAYSNANVYILDYEEIYIDQLNLGLGSVICKDDYDSYFYLYGSNEDSYLIADSLINTYDSGDVYIEDLDVYVNSIYINDELDISDGSHVMADTVTIVINCCGIDIEGNSTLTAGTIYAAVDPYYDYGAYIWAYDNSVLTADDITGTLYLGANANAVINITNDVVTNRLETYEFEDYGNNALINIGGNLTVNEGFTSLKNTSLLNVGGTITTADGNNIYSLNAAILNAAADSNTPYYNDTDEAYVRTTLTDLPPNTLMHFVTSGGTNNMDFLARTNYAGILTVWLIPHGGTIAAYTTDSMMVEYVGSSAIGNVDATIAMVHTVTVTDVAVTADVPEEQVSGQAVSYDNIVAVVSDDQTFVPDYDSYLDVYLMNANEQEVELDTPLAEGTYYLTICYADEGSFYHGTATYTVHVRDQRTITFDANGGSAVSDVLAWKGDDLTLPSSTRSGYRLTGWSDGALTYAAGAAYPVYVDSTLTAQWTKRSSGGSTATYYTITATAGEGGSISPTGSVSVEKGSTKYFKITPDQGYVIDDVVVDGESVGNVANFLFDNITANHTIKATFVEGEATNLTDQYTDLVPGSWYMDGVNYVLTAGLFNGTSADKFSPDLAMTRAMLVTVLWRLSGTTDTSINSFNDVETDLWYSVAVKWAAANGIVSGFGNNMFRPNDNITREQMALILYNYANFMGYDTTQGGMAIREYADYGDISDWAGEAMAWANATGLITGRTDTTLAPNGTATRAEVATILMRFIAYYTK